MQITVGVSKISKNFQRYLTFILFLMYFQNHYLVLSHIRFSRLQKMLLVLQKKFLQRTRQPNNAQLCGNVLAQSWLQYGIKVFGKIFVLQKTEMCDPFQSTITRKRAVSHPHVLIFFLIFSSFSISSTMSRGKGFKGAPIESVTKYQIYHSWAMLTFCLFFFLNKKVFSSDLALIGHNNLVGFFSE